MKCSICSKEMTHQERSERWGPEYAHSNCVTAFEAGQATNVYRIAEERSKAEDRIKRLEEAGDELLDWIGPDVSGSNRKLLANAWQRAKEAKP